MRSDIYQLAATVCPWQKMVPFHYPTHKYAIIDYYTTNKDVCHKKSQTINLNKIIQLLTQYIRKPKNINIIKMTSLVSALLDSLVHQKLYCVYISAQTQSAMAA